VRDRAQRRISEEEPIHLAVQAISLGAVGQRLRLLVKRVPFGQVEARVIRLAFAHAIEDLVERVGVRIARHPAEVPGHEFAGA